MRGACRRVVGEAIHGVDVLGEVVEAGVVVRGGEEEEEEEESWTRSGRRAYAG